MVGWPAVACPSIVLTSAFFVLLSGRPPVQLRRGRQLAIGCRPLHSRRNRRPKCSCLSGIAAKQRKSKTFVRACDPSTSQFQLFVFQ